MGQSIKLFPQANKPAEVTAVYKQSCKNGCICPIYEYWIHGFDSRLLHMKPKNKRIVSSDRQYLENLQKEYQEYGDWDTELVGDTLTVFALHRKYQRRKEKAAQKRGQHRDKRSEKFERRER